MATVYDVPLSPIQNQRLSIILDGNDYELVFNWNDCSLTPCWVIDMLDSMGNPIIQGIPLVTGCDLLAQYSYLGFTNNLIAATDGSPDAVPTFENLGNGSHLYSISVT